MQLIFNIKGVAPFIMHNGRGADPQDPVTKWAKSGTKKQGKQDADHEAIAEKEYILSAYADENNVPYIPADVIYAAIINGAKKDKQGPAAKAGIMIVSPGDLNYEGPTTIAELYKDEKFVLRKPAKIGQKKVVRTRPIFENWSATFTVEFDESVIGKDDVQRAVEQAGKFCGVGDWRPRHGRFEVM